MKRASPKTLIRISEMCFAVSSSSFLFIPKSNFNGSNPQQFIAYLVGILFWGGLLSGVFCMIILDFKRRKANSGNLIAQVYYVFKNKKAKICDLCMAVSIIVFIMSKKQLGLYHTLSLVLLALTVLSIYPTNSQWQ